MGGDNKLEAEIVNSHIKATENTTLAKLSIFDQLKLLISRFSNSEEAELNASERLSVESLRMSASLQNLLLRAGDEMKDKNHTSVTLQVSSKFIPYLDDVINERTGLGQYYNIEVYKKDLPLNVNYMFIIKMRLKVDSEVKE